jgi:hypothetical protein
MCGYCGKLLTKSLRVGGLVNEIGWLVAKFEEETGYVCARHGILSGHDSNHKLIKLYRHQSKMSSSKKIYL